MASTSDLNKSTIASTSDVTKSSEANQLHEEPVVVDLTLLTSKIKQLKQQIEDEKVACVQEKLKNNKLKLERDVAHLSSLADSRKNAHNSGSGNMLSYRMKNPIQLIVPGEKVASLDDNNYEEVAFRVTAKLPYVEKIPRFTTWTHVTRNQRGCEIQSGDINSDDQEEVVALAEPKHEFSKAEKRIIRMVSQDYEPCEEVLQLLTQFIGGTKSEIHEVFKMVKKKDEEALIDHNNNAMVAASTAEGDHNNMNMLLDKSLASCLDTFDKLFCRRCLIFGCKLHGICQPVITPAERIPYIVENQEEEGPCSDYCYMIKLQAAAKDNNTVTWKLLEKDLYLKGLEMFGRNICLIARNLLNGLKTCMQVHTYMHKLGGSTVSSPTVANDHKVLEKFA